MNTLETIQNDHELWKELRTRIKSGFSIPKAGKIGASLTDLESFIEGMPTAIPFSALEAVILDFLRPCLVVKDNSFSVPASDVWRQRLEPYRKLLEKRIPSVGRIEFKYHPRFQWGGTGWLIAENTIVTNRHVAALFASKRNNELTFALNSMGMGIEAFIDFKEEYHGSPGLQVRVEKILYLADEGKPDIAILRLSPGARELEPVPIFNGSIKAKSELAVIGYPAYDPVRNPLKPVDVTRIFSDVFDYKRLSPGLVLNNNVAPSTFTHDATTLGGNSGSVVLDLKTGQAAGLHFKGIFHEENYAVSAQSILEVLVKTSVQFRSEAPPIALPDVVDLEASIQEEAPYESYNDREGYVEDFLGVVVSLPTIADTDSILTFGNNDWVLKYFHFSVVMNASRRMCFYSAVNINGSKSRKTKRPGWRLDPRIPQDAQIKGECYGTPPKYSRGHMTRREDPAWGESVDEATVGNADSMHVTNAVPQMQPFNAGIWLGLEDYALQNARTDEMKISVFTGPFFAKDDEFYVDNESNKYDVRIPKAFWKIIAFIHDETGQLCATGYTMSQEGFIPEEYIFGAYKTYQVSIRSIEQRAGLEFDKLSNLDPYAGEEVIPAPLQDFSQIRFRQ